MLRTCHFAVSYAHNIAAPVYLTELLYFLVSLISFLLHASTTCYFLYSHLSYTFLSLSPCSFSSFSPSLSHWYFGAGFQRSPFCSPFNRTSISIHLDASIGSTSYALYHRLYILYCVLVWILVTYYLLTISAFAATRYRACAAVLTSIISFLARFPVSHSSLG